ncbi:hypothetical protein ABMA28_017370 [Loxostege sticticalis]|uniref:ZAD domain-containing protein n=1 Tax=Loxostege sticticalis TaxID=481309 RepID=A0ABD0S5J7_LOXSC
MDDLCTACLCTGRNLYFIGETGSYHLYSQILNEIPVYDFSEVCVRVCWECRALLRRFGEFKARVKRSYTELLQQLHQNIPPCKQLLARAPRLAACAAEAFGWPENSLEGELDHAVKLEVDDEEAYEAGRGRPLRRYEVPYASLVLRKRRYKEDIKPLKEEKPEDEHHMRRKRKATKKAAKDKKKTKRVKSKKKLEEKKINSKKKAEEVRSVNITRECSALFICEDSDAGIARDNNARSREHICLKVNYLIKNIFTGDDEVKTESVTKKEEVIAIELSLTSPSRRRGFLMSRDCNYLHTRVSNDVFQYNINHDIILPNATIYLYRRAHARPAGRHFPYPSKVTITSVYIIFLNNGSLSPPKPTLEAKPTCAECGKVFSSKKTYRLTHFFVTSCIVCQRKMFPNTVLSVLNYLHVCSSIFLLFSFYV